MRRIGVDRRPHVRDLRREKVPIDGRSLHRVELGEFAQRPRPHLQQSLGEGIPLVLVLDGDREMEVHTIEDLERLYRMAMAVTARVPVD
jgi:hypothetical protein